MTRLPVVAGADVIKVLEKVGMVHLRTRGSHAIPRRPNGTGVTVPLHKPIRPGTLASILRQVGMTSDEFRELL
jgi:predicted RNA binding protein YcfA (HicA-like mRNA interferase family)